MTRYNCAAVAAGLLVATVAAGSPPADQLATLGKQLTPWGAEIAGNKEGTIPGYTGGVTNPPTYDYGNAEPPDPFATDKVQFWIDGTNLASHADKLTAGLLDLFKKHPTFRMAVYPTRRSASYPPAVLENSIKNATRCETKDGGNTLDVSKGCRNGIPFPIPKDGYEAMWNRAMAYLGPAVLMDNLLRYVKPSGEVVVTGDVRQLFGSEFYGPAGKVPKYYFLSRGEFKGPARVVGQASLILDTMENTRLAYSYQPATRRVRLAPDFAGDTPVSSYGGAVFYDEITTFSGTLERYDFKLLGKKEMYIPYNGYRAEAVPECKGNALLTKGIPNPECIRWELHRVWHVQATLKPGKRHVMPKRDIFFDEDDWFSGLEDGYDAQGKLFHSQWSAGKPDYVKHAPAAKMSSFYFDHQSRVYVYVQGTRVQVLDTVNFAKVSASESLDQRILK